MRRPRYRDLALVPAVLALAACNVGSSPTDAPAAVTLQSATLSLAGQPIQDQESFSHDQRGRGALRLEARLTQEGRAAPGHRVRVDVERPHGMMGPRTLWLYDDGTHGDHVPGDGLYCYEENAGPYGFCHDGAGPGPYHYDFCGITAKGAETNRLGVTVNVVD